jgi:hypothetical protein
MDNNYLEAIKTLESTSATLDRILDKASCQSFEDIKAYKILERVIEKVEDSISDLKYFSKDLMYGTLYKLDNGKYAINEDNYFSCGYDIEVWSESDQEWQVGRVEHNRDYYFYNYDGDNFELSEGLRVRIRK